MSNSKALTSISVQKTEDSYDSYVYMGSGSIPAGRRKNSPPSPLTKPKLSVYEEFKALTVVQIPRKGAGSLRQSSPQLLSSYYHQEQN
jgi:hypothetical protein